MTPSAIMTLIITLTARAWDVPIRVMRAEGRAVRWVQARQVAMLLIRTITHVSQERIGQALDRDRTTVIHGIDYITSLAANDPVLRAKIEAIRAEVHAAMDAAGNAPAPDAPAIPSAVCPWANRNMVRQVVSLRGRGMMPGTIATRMGVNVGIVNAVLRETEGAGA